MDKPSDWGYNLGGFVTDRGSAVGRRGRCDQASIHPKDRQDMRNIEGCRANVQAKDQDNEV